MRRRLMQTLVASGLVALPRASHADVSLPRTPTVDGADITEVEVATGSLDHRVGAARVAWSSLAHTNVPPGPRWVTFVASSGAEAALVPWCAGREKIYVGGTAVAAPPGPVVLDLPADGQEHRVDILLDLSGYEHRVTCSSAPRAGRLGETSDGLIAFEFPSPHAPAGGGHAVVFVPPGHVRSRPATLLVGLHPWNGSIWTYSAYDALLASARAHDVVLLFPSGLGNSLYTAAAEDEALLALAAVSDRLAVDRDRVTLWGASMGGAGATTIGFHHPDRFAAIISLFGDSQYDLATYVRGILHDGAGAHRVNALDIVDNARNLPVWLVHGEDDHVSPIRQSAILARALESKQFAVTFDRIPGAGHEGRVVSELAERIVTLAANARRVAAPSRVSFRSVRAGDTEAYGVRIERTRPDGDAFVDLAREGDTVRVLTLEGVHALHLARGSFGFAHRDTPVIVGDAAGVSITWDPP